MKHRLGIATICLAMLTAAHAQLPAEVVEGAQDYDWQTCVDTKLQDCMNNNCSTSEDVDCKESCQNMVTDKCRSQGLRPPE